jgi:hypothetical protein
VTPEVWEWAMIMADKKVALTTRQVEALVARIRYLEKKIETLTHEDD